MRKKIAAALAGIFVVCLVISCLTCHGSQGAEPERENMKTYRPIPKKAEGTGIYRTKQTVKRWDWNSKYLRACHPGRRGQPVCGRLQAAHGDGVIWRRWRIGLGRL